MERVLGAVLNLSLIHICGRIFGGMCACGIVVLGVFRWAAGDISPCGILPDTVFRMGYYVLAVLYVWSKPWENVRK